MCYIGIVKEGLGYAESFFDANLCRAGGGSRPLFEGDKYVTDKDTEHMRSMSIKGQPHTEVWEAH